MRLTKAEKNFINAARVARLATVDARGVPHNVPICPLLDNGKIYFGTEATAKKVRNLKANPSVAILFDDYVEAWDHLCGMMIQGRARVVDTRLFRPLRKKIYAKYLQYESISPLTDGDTVIVEIAPKKKLSWGFSS